MTTSQVLLTAWTWEPSVLVGCSALLAIYVWAVRGRLTGRSLMFLLGVLVLAVALMSPIDTLGDGYLFSAHMIQHLLLILVASPLLIMGAPAEVYERAFAHRRVRHAARVLGNPVLAWFALTFTLWVWHVPALYESALRNENVHVFQHMTFLVAATMFWWPIVSPLPEERINALAGIAYLFTQGVSSSLLGIWLTFAPAGLYPFYLNPPDPLGILPLIRQEWGLTPQADQAFGGLFMWAPSGLIFLGAIIGTLARWFAEPEADEVEAEIARKEALGTATNS